MVGNCSQWALLLIHTLLLYSINPSIPFQCFAPICLEIRTTLSTDQKNTLYCEHLVAAQTALVSREYADKKTVELATMRKLIKSDEVINELASISTSGQIDIWKLPDNIYVVPSFSPPSHESPTEYLHIRNDKCPLSKCKEGKSKLRTLIKKEEPLCVHTVLVHSSVQDQELSKESTSPKKIAFPKLNRDVTTKIVMNQILEKIPSLTNMETSGFIRRSRRYVDKLITNKDLINQTIEKQTLTWCPSCPQMQLEVWPFKPKQAFLFSIGHLVKIQIPLKFCRSCRAVFYPGNECR